MALSPYMAYQAALEAGFKPDPAQQAAAQSLERCYQQLQAGEPEIPGVYLWGPVGRGKTWLMDRFFASLSVPAQRLHFHHFMRWVHRRLFQLTGQADPLTILAKELARKVRVLCLDELFISDIGDVMLLSRLIQQLFAEGLVIVTTSNQAPEQLYENGFNRERLLPAIDAMNQHLEVLRVDGGQDHRLHPGRAHPRYWVNQPEAIASAFNELISQTQDNQITTKPLSLGHREIKVVKRSEQILWCRYNDLCEQPLASADFIELCDQFRYLMLSEVPKLTGGKIQMSIARGTEDGILQVAAGDRDLPELSFADDGVRRFIALVDECYDRNIPLYVDAAVPLTELYTKGTLAFSFRRSLSRLQEMQLARFGQ